MENKECRQITMNKSQRKLITPPQLSELSGILEMRFKKNEKRHPDMDWESVVRILESAALNKPEKIWSLSEMERTGGEPDLVGFDSLRNELVFYDCSPESPLGRRSLCYDREALDARRENKPAGSAVGMAAEMGIDMLTEEQYRQLQELGTFDAKTSSWIITPPDIRGLGGALFADYRYGKVFVYHNGAQSYYGARGFRGCLTV